MEDSPIDYIFNRFPVSILSTIAVYKGDKLLYKNYYYKKVPTEHDESLTSLTGTINRAIGLGFDFEIDDVTIIYQNSYRPCFSFYSNVSVKLDVNTFGHQFRLHFERVLPGTRFYFVCKGSHKLQDLTCFNENCPVEIRDIPLPNVKTLFKASIKS